jgi:acyl-CoA thioesterase-1
MNHRPLLLALALLSLAARCGTAPTPPAAAPATDAPAPDAPAAAAQVRYLALGDSFTIGTGSSPDAAFPARLAARWTSPRCVVALRNPAVNGFTTQDLLDVELPVVRPFGPSLVTLAVGANDLVRGRSLDQYRSQLGRIFEALAAAGVPGDRVVAIPQPDWARSPAARSFGDPEALHATIVAFNEALRAETEARGGRYVDLFPLMMEQARAGRVAGDGLHPDAGAHDAWAEALARQLPDPCAR